MSSPRILVVRLGAMGDVIHALPAVATLKRGFPSAHVTWVIDPKWAVLVEGNPYVDELLVFDRRRWPSVRAAWQALRRDRFDVAVDFQGLIKSALIATVSGARSRIGFHRTVAREPVASLFYNRAVKTICAHVVDQNLELARAAGASQVCRDFPIPPGRAEGELPSGRFVLACPLAGWESKQWPLEYYSEVARALEEDGYRLVVNGAPSARETLCGIRGAHVHLSGIGGLIDATRRAAGVIGIDSGPLHLAAAVGQPGVAIFGPTDPARNGPYGGTVAVLRQPGLPVTYKRGSHVSESMRAIMPEAVVDALRVRLASHAERSAG